MVAGMEATFPRFNFTGEDEDILARTIFGEARGEGFDGKVAVAYVVINRAKIAAAFVKQHDAAHPHYGDGSIASACQSGQGTHHQFSCWNDNDPNLAKMKAASEADPAFYSSRNAARVALNGDLANTIKDCTHYYAPSSLPKSPLWARGKIPYRSIGHHSFFNNIEA